MSQSRTAAAFQRQLWPDWWVHSQRMYWDGLRRATPPANKSFSGRSEQAYSDSELSQWVSLSVCLSHLRTGRVKESGMTRVLLPSSHPSTYYSYTSLHLCLPFAVSSFPEWLYRWVVVDLYLLCSKWATRAGGRTPPTTNNMKSRGVGWLSV